MISMLRSIRYRRLFLMVLSLLMSGIILISLQSIFARAAERTKPVDLSTANIQVAKQNLPVAVYIEVTESREVTNPFLPYQNDPFFRRFFGVPKMPKKFKQELKGLGSGMIIDPQGHILTNVHVAGIDINLFNSLEMGDDRDRRRE